MTVGDGRHDYSKHGNNLVRFLLLRKCIKYSMLIFEIRIGTDRLELNSPRFCLQLTKVYTQRQTRSNHFKTCDFRPLGPYHGSNEQKSQVLK